jgi:hypothetical protein
LRALDCCRELAREPFPRSASGRSLERSRDADDEARDPVLLDFVRLDLAFACFELADFAFPDFEAVDFAFPDFEAVDFAFPDFEAVDFPLPDFERAEDDDALCFV